MPTKSSKSVPIAGRVNRFSYAIRNIVAEAKAVEARGQRVRYLNIGDPVAFGFQTPAHLVETVARAVRDGHNGYVPSAGIPEAREAVAADYTTRGISVSADRVLITTGTSEGIELALNALVDEGDEVLVPSPTYPLYTAVLAKIGAQPRYYRTDPEHDWLPDLEHVRTLVTPRTRVLVVIDPNNPTGAVYPASIRRALIEFAERHDLTILADEVYGDVAYEGPLPLLGTFNLDAPIISFSSLSKAYLAPGWRAGWLVAGRTPRLDDAIAAMKKLADGRLCSPGPMQYAVAAAMTGDRSHQVSFRAALAERARITTDRINAIPGMRCVAPRAAFYALPRITLPPGTTDEQFVLALLRQTGILCVNGSGFGVPATEGFFRIVFLANPSDLEQIYADIAAFTREYLARGWQHLASVTTRPRDTPRALIRYALVSATLTVALVWALYLVRETLLLIYVAGLIAVGLSPLIDRIEGQRVFRRVRMPRWAAILAVYVALFTIIGLFVMLMVPPLATQARDFLTAAPELLARAQRWLIDQGILTREISISEAVRQSPLPGTDAVGTVVAAIWGFVGGIFGVLTILIVTFYFLVDEDNIVRALVRLFPRQERARVRDASRRAGAKVSAWMAGQLLLGAIIGTTAAIGLWALGVPYFYVLALIAAIGELIPIVGPILAAIPAIAVGFSVSPATAFGVIVFFVIQQQVENHVLVPKVMSRQVGISPVLVILALLVGGSLLGLVGAILAVPTAAILQVLLQELVVEASAD